MNWTSYKICWISVRRNGQNKINGLREYATITGQNCWKVLRADIPKSNRGEILERMLHQTSISTAKTLHQINLQSNDFGCFLLNKEFKLWLRDMTLCCIFFFNLLNIIHGISVFCIFYHDRDKNIWLLLILYTIIYFEY